MEKIIKQIKKKEEQISNTEKRLSQQKNQLKNLIDKKKSIEMKELFSVIEEKGLNVNQAVNILQSKVSEKEGLYDENKEEN